MVVEPNLYMYVSTSPVHVCMYACVVVGTDLWGKKLHSQLGISIVVTSGSLHGSTLARDATDLGTIFLIFITPMTHLCMYV